MNRTCMRSEKAKSFTLLHKFWWIYFFLLLFFWQFYTRCGIFVLHLFSQILYNVVWVITLTITVVLLIMDVYVRYRATCQSNSNRNANLNDFSLVHLLLCRSHARFFLVVFLYLIKSNLEKIRFFFILFLDSIQLISASFIYRALDEPKSIKLN